MLDNGDKKIKTFLWHLRRFLHLKKIITKARLLKLAYLKRFVTKAYLKRFVTKDTSSIAKKKCYITQKDELS